MTKKFYSITRLQELQAQQQVAPLSETLQAEIEELYSYFSAMRKSVDTSSSSQPVTIVKCLCGDEVCNVYGLSDGTFNQGCGWPKERAQEYADAINAKDRIAITQAKHKFLPDAPRCIKCHQYEGSTHEAAKAIVVEQMHQPRDLSTMLATVTERGYVSDVVEQVKAWLLDCQHLEHIKQNFTGQIAIQRLIDRLN